MVVFHFPNLEAIYQIYDKEPESSSIYIFVNKIDVTIDKNNNNENAEAILRVKILYMPCVLLIVDKFFNNLLRGATQMQKQLLIDFINIFQKSKHD